MIRSIPLTLAALLPLALVSAASLLPRPQEPPSTGLQLPDLDTIGWRTDLETARREAIAAKKPLFVVFRCER